MDDLDLDLSGSENETNTTRDGSAGAHAEAVAAPPGRCTFKPALIKALLLSHWEKSAAAEDKVPKVSTAALALTAEYLRRFVIEAYKRAIFEAGMDNEEILLPEHIERVMLEIMTDM